MAYTVPELRRSRGLSQRDLAKALGLSHGAIGNIEAGIGGPSFAVARKLASFFGVPLGEISFPGVVDPTPADGKQQSPSGDAPSREEAVS